MKIWRVVAAALVCTMAIAMAANAEEKAPAPAAPPQAGDRAAEEKIQELQRKLKEIEDELARLGTPASPEKAPEVKAKPSDAPASGGGGGGVAATGGSAGSTRGPSSAEADRQVFLNLSERAREKFITLMREGAEKMRSATPEERQAWSKEMLARAMAEDRENKMGGRLPAPADPKFQPVPATPLVPAGPARAAPADRPEQADMERMRLLTPAGQQILREEYMKNREQMMNATPEERVAFFKKMLERAEQANDPKPREAPAPPAGK